MPITNLKLSKRDKTLVNMIADRAVSVGAIPSGMRPHAVLNMTAVHKHLCPLDLDLLAIANPVALTADMATILHNFDPIKANWKDHYNQPICKLKGGQQ